MTKQMKARVAQLEAGAGGALTGAVAGSFGGAPGAAVGAVIGAAAGVIAVLVGEREGASSSARDAELDREIGVTEGVIGAPNLDHPPVSSGAYYPHATVGAPAAPESAGSPPTNEALTSLAPEEPDSWFATPTP
jgi:hypothetical protein